MTHDTLASKYVLGLTGNIACGKSTVLAQLHELGATTIDADAVTRELQRKGKPAYDEIVREFGAGIVQAGGELDRRALGNFVFADPAALRRLELIVHPHVRDEIVRLVAAADTEIVVIDAIKLLESPLVDYCRANWVVTCRPEQQVERLLRKRGLSVEEAWLRINAQPPQAEKIARADVVIDNSGSLDDTRHQVDSAWRGLETGNGSRTAGAGRRNREEREGREGHEE